MNRFLIVVNETSHGMPSRKLCNDVQREGAKLSPDLVSGFYAMYHYTTFDIASSHGVQNCRAAIFLLHGNHAHGGFAANEEKKNYIHSSHLLDQLSEYVITCNANSCSANQWNNGPSRGGITSNVHLRAGEGGSEQVGRHSSKNVQCIQNHRNFLDSWCYTCYVPRDEIVKVRDPIRAPFY